MAGRFGDNEPKGRAGRSGPSQFERGTMELSALGTRSQDFPTVHVISDSVGVTAQTLARAATAQFGLKNPRIETVSRVRTFEEVEHFFEEHVEHHRKRFGDVHLVVFYTLVDDGMRRKMSEYVANNPYIIAVDLIGPAIDALAQVSGREPEDVPGGLRIADADYFQRIEAMEFTIAHDDGRNPQDLTKADIVLVGVSRTSKTPTSIYLSQQGYKVANIPLDPKTDPPKELFDVDAKRIFGLMTTPDVLIGIRQRRLGNAAGVASSYADPEAVYEDLEKARSLMRKLGCIVVRTDNRAVEETAQQILRYYDLANPQ